MANKYTRKSREKQPDANVPDEFISFWQRLYEQIVVPFGRPILLGIAGLGVVLAVWYGVDHWLTSSREAASEQLGRALAIYHADLLTDEQAKAAADAKAKDPEAGKDEAPRFKTDKERLEATLKALDELDAEHGSSSAAQRGKLLRADALFDLGRYDEADAAWRAYADKADGEDPLRAMAKQGEGRADEAKGKLDEAVATYEELGKSGPLKERALLDEARVLEKKGDKQKAAAVLKDLLAKAPATPLKEEASARLAALGGT